MAFPVGTDTEYALIVLENGKPVTSNNPHFHELVVRKLMLFYALHYNSMRWSHGDYGYEDLPYHDIIVRNGGRFYIDHGHPEYASPECDNPKLLVAYDKAGERLMADAARILSESLGAGISIQIIKNNTDPHGQTYGSHENYYARRLNVMSPFQAYINEVIPFLVSRQVVAGAGDIAIDPHGDARFEISQRARFFYSVASNHTTRSRGIFNLRDMPYGSRDYLRIHNIVGDANMSEVAIYVKTGAYAIILSMVEDGLHPGEGLELYHPVLALRQISADPTLRQKVRLADDREMTGLELQWAYFEQAADYVADCGQWWMPEVMDHWERVLTGLSDPGSMVHDLDWVAKLNVLEKLRENKGLAWGSSQLAEVNLRYGGVDPRYGIYRKALERTSTRIVTDADIEEALCTPPLGSRAELRMDAIERFGRETATSWASLNISTAYGRRSFQMAYPFGSGLVSLRDDVMGRQPMAPVSA